MGIYTGHAEDTNTGSTTQWGLKQPATALKRLRMKYLMVGSDATADNAYEARVRRTTGVAETATAFTPTLADPADGAASALFNFNHTVEPTYTANSELLVVAGHQRSTYQWYAMPGSELVVAVSNSAGLGFITLTVTTAFNQLFTVHWEE